LDTPLNTSTSELSATLKKSRIAYLPFFYHFGSAPKEVINKRGEVVYRKFIQSQAFQNGIERLMNGVQKGYTICIIDNESDISQSRRFLYIGRYLQDTINILHIKSNTEYKTQQEIENQIIQTQRANQKNKLKAQMVGQIGEKLAAEYLIKNGYSILDRNWNLHHGCELDLVAIKNYHLHFIEVKTRSEKPVKFNTEDIHPEIAIDNKKIRNISRAIQAYRYQKRFSNIESQIDSIAIIYRTSEDYELHHYLDISTANQKCEEIIYRSKE